MAATSPEGRRMIENFEGCELTAYNDGTGVWTVGYGHTGPDVFPGVRVSQERADELLVIDLHKFEGILNTLLKVSVNPEQYDAMISLMYNIGAGAFSGSSVLYYTNQRQWQDAAESFLLWDKAAGQTLAGLRNRRVKERSLYLTNLPKEGV